MPAAHHTECGILHNNLKLVKQLSRSPFISRCMIFATRCRRASTWQMLITKQQRQGVTLPAANAALTTASRCSQNPPSSAAGGRPEGQGLACPRNRRLLQPAVAGHRRQRRNLRSSSSRRRLSTSSSSNDTARSSNTSSGLGGSCWMTPPKAAPRLRAQQRQLLCQWHGQLASRQLRMDGWAACGPAWAPALTASRHLPKAA